MKSLSEGDSQLIDFTPSLVLVGGKSGIGKTTTIDALLSLYPGYYDRPISYTSRTKRLGEKREYVFVSQNEIREMHSKGLLLTIDEAYGNLYAISTESILEILRAGKSAVKEVHPANHSKIRGLFPDCVSVLLLPSREKTLPLKKGHPRRNRVEQDREYYSRYDILSSDIVLRIDMENLEATVDNLHRALFAFTHTSCYFPRPESIDRANESGYERAAPEFVDASRVTTSNFHHLSLPCFSGAIERYLNKGARVIEIGVGRGWLSKLLPMSRIEYTGIDISSEMIEHSELERSHTSSVRHIDYPDQYFDVALASLADPYFYPAALCEIRRVLRNRGLFIFSSPSRSWSDGIRAHGDRLITSFSLEDGTHAEVFSFTFTVGEIRKLLSICGFSTAESYVLRGEHLSNQEISPAIIESARNKGIDILELPILNFVISRRED